MQWHSARYSRDLYHHELLALIDHGENVKVRGRDTLEILNYVSEVTEPWHHCILLPARRWNPWLALSEALWILAGRDDVAAVRPYNSRIADYSDDGEHLYGAYGARIFDQIDPLIERLRRDPNDRRAVLQIWDNSGREIEVPNQGQTMKDGQPYTLLLHMDDLTSDTKDPPCNDMVFFKLRENKLHMTVMCRSNDIHWGLFAVNLPTFGILQVYLAARLGVEVGTQTHLSNSLHVYTDEPAAEAITDRMLYTERGFDRPAYPEHELVIRAGQLSRKGITHKEFAEDCSEVLERRIRNLEGTTFQIFASDFLAQYREHKWAPEEIRNASQWPDWILAGQLFVDQVWKQREPVTSN